MENRSSNVRAGQRSKIQIGDKMIENEFKVGDVVVLNKAGRDIRISDIWQRRGVVKGLPGGGWAIVCWTVCNRCRDSREWTERLEFLEHYEREDVGMAA